MKYILIIFALFVLVEPTYADFIIPPEVGKIEQLSGEAFSKVEFFKQSQTLCINNNCGTIYAEINRTEDKIYFKGQGGNYAVEGYVMGGITYVKDFHSNSWKKAKGVPIGFSDMLSPNPCSIEHCLRLDPTDQPDKILLEDGLVDGKEYYVVNIIYPEQTKNNTLKTITNKIFFQKDTRLPYEQHLVINIARSKMLTKVKFYDYNIPLEIRLPQEAIGAEEITLDEMETVY